MSEIFLTNASFEGTTGAFFASRLAALRAQVVHRMAGEREDLLHERHHFEKVGARNGIGSATRGYWTFAMQVSEAFEPAGH